MVIRKLYRIESAHVVRKAVSERCSHNYHGHSGKIEVFFKATNSDNAGMVYDFGAFKKTIGSFIDMFDHSVHLYSNDKQENIEFFKRENERYIIFPFNPTAENYALFFKTAINEILDYSKFTNGEDGVYCSGVRYHETETGYAQSELADQYMFSIADIEFSDQTIKEASKEIQKIIKRIKNGK
ncbi:6-carboxytetrahydropterin synthase [uncultured Clostridium sp.]|uniref:6-pyruvoyl trahydropterin synthase family protein n=1 Tax=uncultured Clostridium sp. TaxID=59620 RepID=UPI002614D21E|nr:6-carboxytetrahydropterin synthase [uncultured Clostridium sp.]